MEAAKEGFPAIAFSGTGAAHEAWTQLVDAPSSTSVVKAVGSAALATKLVNALLAQPAGSGILPSGIILNVNFPSLDPPCSPDTVQFVLTRVFPPLLPIDVKTCNNGHKLPAEDDVVNGGCFASISVVDAKLRLDALEPLQKDVLNRLSNLPLSCFPN